MSEPIVQTTTTELFLLVPAYPERKWDNRKNGKRGSYRIGFFGGGKEPDRVPPLTWPRPAAAGFPHLS